VLGPDKNVLVPLAAFDKTGVKSWVGDVVNECRYLQTGLRGIYTLR
jgi:hypothetical protein